MLVSDLLVFVVLKHADAVFDDEEEVDAGERCEALPHAVKVCSEVGVVAGSMLAVVVLALRLEERRGRAEDDGLWTRKRKLQSR